MSIFTLILIIIIINVFNRLLEGSQKQTEEAGGEGVNERLERIRQQNQQRQTDPEPFEPNIFEQFDDFFKEEKSYEPEEDPSIEDQRQKQLEKLAHRMDASLNPEEEEEYSSSSMQVKRMEERLITESSTVKKEKMQKRLRNKLNKDGLIDSVIMAEVLGKPRSMRPYENVFMRK